MHPDGPARTVWRVWERQVVTDADGAQITASRTYYDGEAEQGLPLGELYAPVARLRRKHSRAQWIVDLARVGAMETG